MKTSSVQSTATFESMRQYILDTYQNTHVGQSFVLGNDQYDCIPVLEQPSASQLGLARIASPPPPSAAPEAIAGGDSGPSPNTTAQAMAETIPVTSQLAASDKIDAYGNSRSCAAGTIPMRRITLEEVSRFPSLKAYLQKTPDGADRLATTQMYPSQAATQAVSKHTYAYTYQNVANLGQTTTVNLWSPYVDTAAGQIFSLAQSWTTGITDTGVNQTVEVGWQNYPAHYGDQRSRLFIYWTADSYQYTGCYNLDCAGFVQTNANWYFGGPFPNYSTPGGAQYELRTMFQLYQGNWWLALGTPDNMTWVGYYPATLFGNGPMHTGAQHIEFGSESVGSTTWPAEGSGNWASSGYSYAGYQRQIWYYAPDNTAQWARLSVAQPSPSCYSIAGPYSAPTNYWGIYFYFGGPGGTSC